MIGTETLPLSHRATGNRADPYTEPNSCLSDFSDSLNSLILLNSMKIFLHLEKTPLSTSNYDHLIAKLTCFILKSHPAMLIPDVVPHIKYFSSNSLISYHNALTFMYL